MTLVPSRTTSGGGTSTYYLLHLHLPLLLATLATTCTILATTAIILAATCTILAPRREGEVR